MRPLSWSCQVAHFPELRHLLNPLQSGIIGLKLCSVWSECRVRDDVEYLNLCNALRAQILHTAVAFECH